MPPEGKKAKPSAKQDLMYLVQVPSVTKFISDVAAGVGCRADIMQIEQMLQEVSQSGKN